MAISGSMAGLVQSAMETIAPEERRVLSVRKPIRGASICKRSNAAGAPKPTFQPMDLSPAFRRSCRSRSCLSIPCKIRGSSMDLFMVMGMNIFIRDFVARCFQGTGSAPAPDQDYFIIGGIVETVPVTPICEYNIAFRRG